MPLLRLNARQQAKKQGIIAVARKLLILTVFEKEQPYDPNKKPKLSVDF